MYGAGRVNFCRFSVCIDKSGKTYTLKVYVSVRFSKTNQCEILLSKSLINTVSVSKLKVFKYQFQNSIF